MRFQHPFRSVLLSFASPAVLLASLGNLGCTSDQPPTTARQPREITSVSAGLAPVVEGNNAFALSLYRAASAAPDNLFFSPFSVTAALGMTYGGARTETAQEMREVLQIGTDDANYHQQLGALMADLGGEHGRGYDLLVANRLFGQDGSPFEQEFLTLTSDAYGAPLDAVDYAGATEDARAHINGWVSEQTDAEIDELFAKDDVDGDTRLVLANAIYFKAAWAESFDPANTTTRPFTRPAGDTVAVPIMSQTGTFRSLFREDVSALEMSYQDDEVSIVLLLPPQHDSLPTLEAALDEDYLAQLLEEMHEGEVVAELPRFELEAKLPLAQLLQEMGMTRAFDDTAADFSGILDPAVERLFVSSALHKAVVRVDEWGTVAAAATGVGVSAVSLPPTFTADRPFVYLIRDRLTGSILFTGRILDPTQTSAG